MLKKLSIYSLTLTVLFSCSQNTNPLKLISGNIFSTRQQGATQYVGMVQLKLPALLKEAKIVDGKAVVNDELKQAIIDEQEEFISRLEEISPDIKVLAKYRMVLNAVAFVAPSDVVTKIEKLEGVLNVVQNSNFERPKIMSTEAKVGLINKNLNDHSSVTFIAADELHKLGIKGQGMKVGVIDTGIDYTHKMFGGPGTAEAYKSINPNEKTDLFPNDKIVGGVDFVGTEFNAASSDVEKQIPIRDLNPIDEAEHGTHVAGTVGGIGDGVNTYTGVAPEAKIYALKVFGKEGSTSDIAVIQALEFAADVTETMENKNHLDVVNLSLGGGFGKPKILYNEAIRNLTRGGTVVVASAGNSGDNPYITGAPATSDDAISIAASIDDQDHNIISKAIEINLGSKKILADLVEGTISSPAHDSKLSGELVYIGNGADPIAEDVATKVAGKIALIDRGVVGFVAKIEKAISLKAVGVVVANNQDSAPIQMGGDKHFDIPAVMITKAIGTEIKQQLKTGSVSVNFTTEEVIRHEEKIDLITDFSSRGPRSMDSLIKPEIAAPGENIISAAVGTGFQGVQMSGTSMAAPHMAGVMTLLKQGHKNLSALELKALVMNTSKIMMKDGKHIPVSLQGAGRVQVAEAYNSKLFAMPASLSLGEVKVASNKAVSKEVTFTNISNQDLVLTSKSIKGKNVDVSVSPGSFKVKANSTAKVVVSVKFKRDSVSENNIESDGFVIFTTQEGKSIHLPFLGVMNKVTDIKASNLITQTDSMEDRLGSEVKLTLMNKGKIAGDALLFNLLGTDEKKTILDPNNLSANTSCDLEAAGVRIVDRVIEGKPVKMLQVGIKLYDTLTFWQPCDVSLQIDNNNDGIADLELVGTKANYISGISASDVASILLDAHIAKEIRSGVEKNGAEENYIPAILDVNEFKFYDHGSVAIVETDLSKIQLGKNKSVKIKLAVSHLEANSYTSDDYLASHEEKWQEIFLTEESFAFTNLPEKLEIGGNEMMTASFKRGSGKQRLLVLYPFNTNNGNTSHDSEIQILSEKLLK